jgi:hypothetical protein
VQKLLPATTVVVPEQVLTQADKTREYTAISKLSGILKQEGMNEEKFKQVEKRLIDAFEGEGARKAQGLPRTLTPTALDDIAQQLTAAYKATTNPIIIAIIRKLYDLFNAELSEEMQKKLRSIIEQRAQPSEQKIEEVAVGTPGAVTAESAMASSGEKQESKNIPQKRAATTPSRKAKAKTPSPGKKKQKPSVTKPPQSSTTKKEELQYLPDVVKQNL